MRFQKWPDGGNAWTLFIWGRHPKGSITWTHGLSVSMERKGAWEGSRSWAKFLLTRHFGLLGFYFRLGRLHGRLERQKPHFVGGGK